MHKIAVIVGSLRKESFNKKLMLALDKLEHPSIEFNQLELHEVPLFNQDNEMNLPPSVGYLKKAVTEADGVLFVTPEYNRSIPGVLKNIIDWGTRPFGNNCWKNKPIGMIGTSPGKVGTAVAQAHLRSILSSIGAIVFGMPEVYLVYQESLIDQKSQITDENTKKFLQSYLDSFSQWLNRVSK